jgi:hypothetical protein
MENEKKRKHLACGKECDQNCRGCNTTLKSIFTVESNQPTETETNHREAKHGIEGNNRNITKHYA